MLWAKMTDILGLLAGLTAPNVFDLLILFFYAITPSQKRNTIHLKKLLIVTCVNDLSYFWHWFWIEMILTIWRKIKKILKI